MATTVKIIEEADELLKQPNKSLKRKSLRAVLELVPHNQWLRCRYIDFFCDDMAKTILKIAGKKPNETINVSEFLAIIRKQKKVLGVFCFDELVSKNKDIKPDFVTFTQ